MDTAVPRTDAPRSSLGELRDYRNVVVLAACIVTQFVSVGLPASLGVLHVTLLETFGESQSLTAAVTTTCIAMTFLIGSLASLYCLRFGATATITLGGALAVVGLLASFFGSSISYLIVSDSVLTGIGSAFIMFGGVAVCVNQFDKDRNIAIGIISAGGGIGIFSFQQLQYYVLAVYGWRGSKLIFSGLALHCLLAARVISCFQNNKSSSQRVSFKLKVPSLQFLKNCTFVVWLVYVLASSLALPLPHFALLDYSKQLGFMETSGLWMLSIHTIFGVSGRFAIGLIVHYYPHQALMFMMLASGIYGTVLVLLGFIELEIHGFLLSVAGGFCVGLIIGGCPLATLKISGLDLFAQYYGLTTTTIGIAMLLCGPILGWVTDISGGYSMAFAVGGSVCLCACAILCIEEVVQCHCKSTHSQSRIQRSRPAL